MQVKAVFTERHGHRQYPVLGVGSSGVSWRGCKLQFRLPAAVFIFIGSYLPLSLILLAQDYDYTRVSRPLCWKWLRGDPGCILPFGNALFSIGIFLCCLICFGFTLATLAIVKPKRAIKITEARYIPTDLMNYTLPYVVSFMGIGYQETGKFVGLIIFLGWMFWITYKSGQIILNPILIAFGWRLYDLTYRHAGDDIDRTGIGLAEIRLASGESHRHATIQDVLIIKVPKDMEK